MVRQGRVRILLLLVGIAAAALIAALLVRLAGQQRFAIHADSLAGWTSYGGSWSVDNGVIHNDSDERGAKLVTGDPRWADYTLRADVKFDGDHGDLGVIIRSNDEEEGVDAYNGYYIGLRTVDGTLVGGRSDYGWMESRSVPVIGGIDSTTWYRLTVTAVGCDIAAQAENLSTGQKTWIAMTESPCVRHGRVGLRSLATGGSWKNLTVEPATRADLLALERHAAAIGHPEFPRHEADYNRLFRFSPVPSASSVSAALPKVTEPRISDLLGLSRLNATPVVVRGIVTLTSPQLYVQDASAGVRVEPSTAVRLNVGDDVEVSGDAHPGLYSTVITQATVRQLWPGIPFPPVSVTPLEAALGSYDRRFVEVDGRLTRVERGQNGREVLDLEDRGESFRAIYAGTGTRSGRTPAVGSYLRVRGICVLDPRYTGETVPFALLLRSEDDFYVLAGPPWWTPFHLALLFAAALALALGVQVAYFRIRQWKTLLVTEERERMAHDIHDTMAQSFAGVGYQLQGIRSGLRRGECRDWQQIEEQLNVACSLVSHCHNEASRTIAMLASTRMEEKQDLLRQLEQTTVRIAQGHVKAIAVLEGVPSRIDLRVADALLHIGQEAITNALSHAHPSLIRITLAFELRSVTLKIQDDGCSFVMTPENAGFGILGMQRRAREIGAKLVFRGTPGQGTTVQVTAALRAPAAHAWRVHGFRRIRVFRKTDSEVNNIGT